MHFNLDDILYHYGKSEEFTLSLSTQLMSHQVTTLIGSNGSGKSTTIKILTGQAVRYSGSYTIDSKEVLARQGDMLHRFNIGYSPEKVELDDELTGGDIALLLKEIRGITESDFSDQMRYFRKMLNVEEWFEHSRCGTYSMGMRKKTALIIAFLGYPRYLILDEPTNGLDPLAVFGLKQMILKKKEEGIGTLLSSHILDFVEKLADHVLIIKKGHLTFDGSLGRLHEQWPDYSLDEIYFTLYNGSEEQLVSLNS